MLFNLPRKLMLGLAASLALATLAAAQPSNFHPDWNKPVAERLAAIPNLSTRLAALDKALNEAKDKTGITATTARYTVDVIQDALANPKLYEGRRPGPRAPGTPGGPAAPGAPPAPGGPAPAPAPAAQTPPVPPSKLLSAYVSPLAPLAYDLADALNRAEQGVVALKAGHDPLAKVSGDVHLAYRSSLDGMLMPYRIFVPKNYTAQRSWPLIVFLHGAVCDENTFMNSETLQPFAERLGYIIVSVNGRGPMSGYTKASGAHQDVFDVMGLAQKMYNIDAKRVFLTGHSMGGMGTWSIGLEYRDKFAAIAPQAGTRAMDDLDGKLAEGKKIPILITLGGKDTSFPVDPGIAVYQKLMAAGYPTKIVVYPLDTHNPVFTSSTPEVFAWFEKYGGTIVPQP